MYHVLIQFLQNEGGLQDLLCTEAKLEHIINYLLLAIKKEL